MWVSRVIIPPRYWAQLLEEVHEGGYMWWPGMDKTAGWQEVVKWCTGCQLTQNNHKCMEVASTPMATYSCRFWGTILRNNVSDHCRHTFQMAQSDTDDHDKFYQNNRGTEKALCDTWLT